jgi:hypothetical protein
VRRFQQVIAIIADHSQKDLSAAAVMPKRLDLY